MSSVTGLFFMVIVWLVPVQQTAHCVALHEPLKHGDIYLSVTNSLECSHNWYTAPIYLQNAKHWPSVWNSVYRPTIRQIMEWSDEYPGRTWLVLNEPERDDQADTAPDDAAIHMTYLMEAVGESGTVACCGVIVGPGRPWAEWLDAYIAAGGPIPAAWHIHIYEDSPAQWEESLALWDEWNASHGALPTIVSEAGFGESVYAFVQEFDRDDVWAVFWFGLPISEMSSHVELTFFPLVIQ